MACGRVVRASNYHVMTFAMLDFDHVNLAFTRAGAARLTAKRSQAQILPPQPPPGGFPAYTLR